MKKPILQIVISIGLLLSGCTFESIDPNTASEEEVLGTREGLISTCIGLRAYYSTNSLLWVIENNALTTHEVSVTSSFQTAWELEEGEDNLTSFNSNIGNIWTSLLKVRSLANSVIQNVDGVDASVEEKKTIKAVAYFYQAASTGFLAQFFTHIPVNDQENANFFNRTLALEECVALLEEAYDLITDTNINAKFIADLCGQNFDLENTILVYLSRYQLQLGNDQEVLDILSMVDPNSVSLFEYGPESPNPIFNRVYGSNLYYQAVDNFGLASTVDGSDNRITFYLVPQEASSQKGIDIEMLKGFYDDPQTPIPVYLPGEIYLNRAEAFLNLNMPDEAVDMINQIRTKTNDPLGINADIGPYTGSTSTEDLKAEIFRQRCIELYMSGLKLEDSRRLKQPSPLNNQHGPLDRSRDFYPFPDAERTNNSNTPENPPI